MKDNQNEEMEIDLLELFLVLLRRWKMLLLGLVIGGVAAGGLTMLKPPVYESEAMLFILSKTTSITSVADLQLGSALSSDFEVIAVSKPVIDTAIGVVKEERHISLTREEVWDMITVANKEDTRVLVITAQNEDAELACTLANAITEATASQMASIMKSDPPTTVERAEVATEPVDNGLKRNAAIGALLGFLFVAVLYIVPFVLNDKIRGTDDIEKYLELGVLGVIPMEKSRESGKRKKAK